MSRNALGRRWTVRCLNVYIVLSVVVAEGSTWSTGSEVANNATQKNIRTSVMATENRLASTDGGQRTEKQTVR